MRGATGFVETNFHGIVLDTPCLRMGERVSEAIRVALIALQGEFVGAT